RHSPEKTLQVRGRFRLATGCLVARYGLLHRPRNGRPLYGHKFSELLDCTRLVGEKAAQQNGRGAGIGKGVMGVAFEWDVMVATTVRQFPASSEAHRANIETVG